MTLKMAEDQGINPTNNIDSPNSIPAETKASKADAKRRQKQEKKKSKNVYVCEVCLLDGTELVIEVEKNSHGEVLFSKVVENLDIVDKEYFGLRFVQDNSPTKCWLQHRKPIKKQLKIGELKFQFAVKFYEPEPGKHLDEYTRYLLYLQLREDIVYGRLHCPTRTYVLLGSFTAQAEFGDYDFSEHGTDYLDGYQLGPAEVEKEDGFVKRVIDIHKEHRGENPAEAELNFLEVAKRTPRYGVDIHYARNKKGVPIEVGISHKGIIVYEDGEPTDSYGWRAVDLVAYKRRKFMLKLFSSEKRKNPRFSMHKRRDAKNMYISAIEHHSFFRLTNADPSKRAADSLMIGSRFRYSERTLYQIRSDPSFHERHAVGKFSRAPSKRPRAKSEKNRLVRAPVVAEKEKPDVKEKEPEEDFEEIEIDETKPDQNKFDPNEWIIVEKVLPDGTTKRYRRRVTTTTSTTTTTKTTYVIRKGTEEEEHVMEEKPIESPRKEETVVITRKESPENSEKEVTQEVKFEDDSNQQVVTTVITKETIVTEDKREQKLNEEAEPKPMSLAEIRGSAKKPSAAVKPLMREDIENEAEPTAPTKVLVYNVDKQETVKIVTKEEREAELRRREIEEEQQRQEEIRARNEREAALRRKWKEEEQKRKEEEALEKRQKEMEAEEEAQKNRALSPELQEISLSTGNEEFDKEFGIRGMDTFLIKTSPMPSQFMRELDEELNRSNDPDESRGDDDDDELDASKEEEKSQSLDTLTVDDTRKAKTLDRKFVRRPPPERSSGYIRRSYGNELDFDYSPGSGARTMPRKMRKYVPLITKEELLRAYSSGGLHDESVISKQEPVEEKSRIEYSLKEESGVEQGEHGFVKSLIGRHETIKHKEDVEIEERRRSRVYSSAEDSKGVVPTRSTSFANVEKPEVKKTKVPPPVRTKPVVFHPDKSGQAATAEVRPASACELRTIPMSPESSPVDKSEDVNKFPIPEVITTSVVFDSEAPTTQRTTSGYIDKDNVEQLWGKVVLKQRRSFRASESFDGLSNFDAFKLKERGFLSIREDAHPRERLFVNIAAPEIVLDKEHRPRDDHNQKRIEVNENGIPKMLLGDLSPDDAASVLYLQSNDDPCRLEFKDRNLTANNIAVEESISSEIRVDGVFNEFNLNWLESQPLEYTKEDLCNGNVYEEVEKKELSNGDLVNESPREAVCKNEQLGPGLMNGEHLDEIVGKGSRGLALEKTTEDKILVKDYVKVSQKMGEDDFKLNEDKRVKEVGLMYAYNRIELDMRVGLNICESKDELNLTENTRDAGYTPTEYEISEEPEQRSNERPDEINTEACQPHCTSPGLEENRVNESRDDASGISEMLIEADSGEEPLGKGGSRERKRFDSCPNLSFPLSQDSNKDDVFTNEAFAVKESPCKDRKPKGSFARIKKQSQKRKPASEGQHTKKMSLTENCELGRLKKEYDSTLAAFLKQRSKSLDDVLVSTQTISVSPAESTPITPPPPDVINHSDAAPSTSMDITDETFPTPPPDVVTQTITTSPSTSTTVIETREVFSTQQYPPEVETHTVVITSDGGSTEEFERMISSDSVTTSETTISKTITTELITTSTEQKVVISGEGEISEELQQALKDAAETRGPDGQ